MKSFLYALLMACLVCGVCCTKESGDKTEEPTVEGKFRLQSMLQSNMVIQQNQPFRVWGNSKTGVKITAKASWDNKEYSTIAAQGGSWAIDIPVPAAPKDNAPQSITVSTTLQTETLTDLLIGEVWVLGGQSNMTFWMSQVVDAVAEIAAADYPEIRYYTVFNAAANEPQTDWRMVDVPDGYHAWRKVTPPTAGYQSAVGYFFGRMLHQKMGVPIGLINTATGGATAQSYAPREALMSDPDLKATFLDTSKPDMEMTVKPCGLYNNMVAPILPYSIKGVIWYQGEGNWGDYAIYPKLMKALMGQWREGFGHGKIPFHCVQIAPYSIDTHANLEDPSWFYLQIPSYFFIREAQGAIRDQEENSGMAVTLDVGNPVDIHPNNKKPVGERLARIALNMNYGYTDVECLGPRYKSHKVENGVVKISFDNAEGLMTSDNAAPRYFYVGPNNSQYKLYPTTAEIHGTEMWLTCPAIVKPATKAEEIVIRYACLMYPTTNVQNGDGLPMEQFRTDNWASNWNAPANVTYVLD